MNYPPKTLVVDRWSSSCGDCGKAANPASKTHDILLGWGPTNGDPGCGVEWENVTSNYVGMAMEEAIRNLRPDLNYIGPLDKDWPGR